MIPTIEDICTGLAAGTMTTEQAIAWFYQHVESAAEGGDGGLRDSFAIAAMQGDWASQDDTSTGVWANNAPDSDLQTRAKLYYRMADAMLAVR